MLCVTVEESAASGIVVLSAERSEEELITEQLQFVFLISPNVWPHGDCCECRGRDILMF